MTLQEILFGQFTPPPVTVTRRNCIDRAPRVLRKLNGRSAKGSNSEMVFYTALKLNKPFTFQEISQSIPDLKNKQVSHALKHLWSVGKLIRTAPEKAGQTNYVYEVAK